MFYIKYVFFLSFLLNSSLNPELSPDGSVQLQHSSLKTAGQLWWS